MIDSMTSTTDLIDWSHLDTGITMCVMVFGCCSGTFL